jgi:metal-responsive CopG/Arc/MetJ family transcriptional regulator
MNRINVTFYDETIEKLEERMKINGGKSIAHCIRELVDLGLKVEKITNGRNQKVVGKMKALNKQGEGYE